LFDLRTLFTGSLLIRIVPFAVFVTTRRILSTSSLTACISSLVRGNVYFRLMNQVCE